jgi:hypothetical protein
MRESGFETNDKGWLTQNGLIAYYERHGRLAEDAIALGVGSVDDHLAAQVSLTGTNANTKKQIMLNLNGGGGEGTDL